MRAWLRSSGIRWIATLIGTVILAALVWEFGPLLWFLDNWIVLTSIVVVMLLVWLGLNLWIDRRRRRREAALAAAMSHAEPDPTALATAEEAAAVSEKLQTALTALRRARGTRGYLYEQPWYVIIGPPGAGKTTALLNAGLRFPLAAEMGQTAVAGVGGTRLCDWWFTEDAVLIDTAGRYTTQDSDAAVDKAGWEAFLDVLKSTRARMPLNGIIVAIALSDIALAPPAERLAHARAVRRRIKEVEERLAIRLPVYVIFTKADLIAGFMEFFDDLDRDRRAQVWGATFPLATRDTGQVAEFPPEFNLLVEQLNNRIFDRLQAERSPDRRGLIAGFAPQMESLEGPLNEFLHETFVGSRLDPAPMLRGFYFTSGTQEGTPIDRLTGTLARSFGIDQSRMPSLRPQQGRSYFLGTLIKDVIFGEAMLVVERPGAAWRRRVMRASGFAAVGLIFLIGAGLLWHARIVNQREADEMAAALADYEETARGLNLDPVSDGDLPQILPLLDQARALPHGYDKRSVEGATWLQLGLSQSAKLAAGARSIYRHALERVLLPRLVWRLETQMHSYLSDPDILYQATRVYLMLGGKGPLDRDLVQAWMSLDWERTYPGVMMAPSRDALMRHLTALLAQPLPAVTLDDALVSAAQITFTRVTPASRVYSLISPSAEARALSPWTPAEALGAAGVRVVVRASGKPLTEGVPGFYTVDGFYSVLLPLLPKAVKQVTSESWVLGTKNELNPNSVEAQQLERDVINLYQEDYQKHWDEMLGDLSLVPLRTPQQAAQDLYILGSAQSPIRDLLSSVARQLTLTKPPATTQGSSRTAVAGANAERAAANAASNQAANAATNVVQGLTPNALSPVTSSTLSALRPLMAVPPPRTGAGATAPQEPPGKKIDDAYKPLRDYVGKGPGAPIDQTLKNIDALRLQLTRLANTAPGAAPAAATGDDPVQLLQTEAPSDPQPVRRWIEALAADAGRIRIGGAQKQVHDAWNASGGPAALCRQAVAGRYPFTGGSANDIPLDDFTKLFAPGGLIDGFFNTQMRPFVDISGSVWHSQTVDGVGLQISPADLAQFQRAAAIRDLFFSAGNTPAVRFDLTPLTLDDSATQATLDLGGTTVEYAHGPPRATQVTWPGSGGMATVRLVFEPAPKTGTGALQSSGPWALFHLFDQGSLHQEDSPERYRLTFQLGERQVSYEIRAGSVLNPFAANALRGFQCPNL